MQMVLKRACSRSFTSYDDTPISILGANHARATNHPPSAAVPAGRRSRCVRTLRSLRLITEERRSHMRDAEIPLADRLWQLPVGERRPSLNDDAKSVAELLAEELADLRRGQRPF